MRHLMWILTWIAVGIGGALGAASVIMLSGSSRTPPAQQAPETITPAKEPGEPVLVNKPKPGTPGRSALRHRHYRMAKHRAPRDENDRD
ncbi:MAG TPA: hypothetical protein VEC60_04190 [Reyranella sp.]|nr:hypothetical protein [Reyranella sp.]